MGKSLTVDRARTLFDYDAESGRLFWKRRDTREFRSPRAANVWNGKLSGNVAGSINDGYVKVGVDGETYAAHRIIWLIETGAWPGQLDHINGDKADNRFVNLRDVTHAENMKNKARPRSNSSGCAGVSWEKAKGLWVARISVEGRLKTLGRSKEKKTAIELRKAAEAHYGYAPLHGRAA